MPSQQLVMRDGDRVTYIPKTGGVYLGSTDLSDIKYENPMEYMGSTKLMDLKVESYSQLSGTVRAGDVDGFFSNILNLLNILQQ